MMITRAGPKLSNHPEYDQQDEGHDHRYGYGAEDPEAAREEHEHWDLALPGEASRPRRSGRRRTRCLPLAPDVAEQCAVACQVGGGADDPALRGAVSLGLARRSAW